MGQPKQPQTPYPQGYFEKYTNLHRLASEAILTAVTLRNKAALDEAERYAKEALAIANSFYEIVLAHGILNTVSLERIVFAADMQGKVPNG